MSTCGHKRRERRERSDQVLEVLDDELVSIVQFVHGDGERELPLSQCEVLVDLRIRIGLSHNKLKREERKKEKKDNLKLLVEILHLTQIVEELGHPLLVVFNKAVQGNHKLFFCVVRLVGQVLQHFRNLEKKKEKKKKGKTLIIQQGDKGKTG